MNRSRRAAAALALAAMLALPTLAAAQDARAAAPPSPSTPTPPNTPEPPQTAPAPQAPLPPQAPPPAPSKPPSFTFEFHGFAGVTLFAQDGQTRGPGLADGQLAMWAASQNAAAFPAGIGGKQPGNDPLEAGGDIRQTRLNFSLAGPQVWSGARPKAVAEFDFANGNGPGNYGNVNIVPRVRLGYFELDWGKHRLLFGQQNDLTVAFVSYSLSHLAFPLAFASGLVGWRRPGVFGYHTVAGDRADGWLELAWELGSSHWATGNSIGIQGALPATPTNAGGDRFGFNAGQASALPTVQVRASVGQGSKYQLYAAGHWNRVDRSGADAGPPPTTLDVLGLQVGGRGTFGPLTLQFQGFTGKNLAAITGAFVQFQANSVNDVHEYGGYVQAGYNFTPEWSVWGMLGTDKINGDDARAANAANPAYGVVQNVVSQGFVQYRLDRLGFSLEWTHFFTKTLGSDRTLDANLHVNQGAFNAMYFF